MADNDKQEKKIIVDDDWKQQAQKEKEALVREEQKEREAKEQQAQQAPQLPDADFSALISMIATQVFYALGLITTEQDKDRPIDLNLAKFNIDMLAVIEEKTKGNLSDEEKQLLDSVLDQARMAFVKISGNVSEKG